MYYFRITKRQKQILIDLFKTDIITFNCFFKDEFWVFENHSDIDKCFNYLEDCFLNRLLPDSEPTDYEIEIEDIATLLNHQLVLNNSEKEFSKKNSSIYLEAKAIFFKCDGRINQLYDETKKLYKKFKIPLWLEENWLININNKELEKKLK